jgi:hypothetical protein
MQEERGCPGARERRGDLAADDPGLAHPGHDDPAAALEQHLDGAFEVTIDGVDQAQNRRGLGAQHRAGEIEQRRSKAFWT